MNVQEIWKKYYRELKTVEIYNERVNWESAMKNYRYAAALERKLAAAQRTIEAQAKRIEELEDDVDAFERDLLIDSMWT